MGYPGPIGDSQKRKGFLMGPWRFLILVLIMCMSSRKAGSGGMGAAMQLVMASLLHNKPYSFNNMIFFEIDNQRIATRTERFLLYPRFL